VPHACLTHEVVHQKGNVVATVTQRRQGDGENVQPIVEVLAEVAGHDELLEALIGRGQDPDVDLDQLLPPDAVKLLLFEDPKQLCLGLKRHLPDLVEEDGSAAGEFEQPLAGVDGAGEGPFLVPKEFTLEQRLG